MIFFFSGICATCRKTLRALFTDEKEAATVTLSVPIKHVNVVEEMANLTLVGLKHIFFINTRSQHVNGINVNSSAIFETRIQICAQ